MEHLHLSKSAFTEALTFQSPRVLSNLILPVLVLTQWQVGDQLLQCVCDGAIQAVELGTVLQGLTRVS